MKGHFLLQVLQTVSKRLLTTAYLAVWIYFKLEFQGNSLVVQWLGLFTFAAKGPGSVPGQGTKILQATWVWPKNQSQINVSNDKFHMYIVHTVKQWELFTDHSKRVEDSLCYAWRGETLNAR